MFGEAKKKCWCSLRLKFDTTKQITKFEKVKYNFFNLILILNYFRY